MDPDFERYSRGSMQATRSVLMRAFVASGFGCGCVDHGLSALRSVESAA